jgi:hypothetical protein
MGVVWLLSVSAGLAALWVYARAPGVAAAPPERWPADSGIAPAPDRATLVMLVHPHCPCSRASIEELSRLMAHADGRVAVHILFLKPSDFPEGWEKTDLWRSAAAIPGTTIRSDPDGVEAARFHAATSGQVILYDAGGRLVFSGGITDARGHAGDSAGRAAIASLIRGAAAAPSTPVFGCALRDPDATPCEGS